MTHDAIARMKQDYIAEASEQVGKLAQRLAGLDLKERRSRSQVDWLFRASHSLKGTSAMFELPEVSRVAAATENLLELVRSAKLEMDCRVVELLLEALDEISLLLQREQGADVQVRPDAMVAEIEALVESVSKDVASRSTYGNAGALLPPEDRVWLAPKEQEEILLRIVQGQRVFRLELRFALEAACADEEEALRLLQECGEILAVGPPVQRRGTAGRRLTLICAVGGTGENLEKVARRYHGVISELRLPASTTRDGQARCAPCPKEVSPPEPSLLADEALAASTPLSVKVDLKLLDSMMNTISQLYSVRLGLDAIAKTLPRNDQTRRLRDDLLKLGLLLNKRLLDLEETVVSVRLVPVSMLFERYRCEVRRLARQSGKKVKLRFEGQATLVDRAMLDRLHDPLLHIVRNAVDHGIEPPARRVALHKAEEGTIALAARQEASHICIHIQDDGKGIDLDRVREIAARKGIASDKADSPVALLFEPGMTTKEDVGEISGRGVGLDAAKSGIDAMRGMITVKTEVDQGTTFSIWVPLTLAVSRGILMEEGSVPVVVPLRSVAEVGLLKPGTARNVRQTGWLEHGGTRVKVVDLSLMLGLEHSAGAGAVVILKIGSAQRAVSAQRVCGETETVSRPLPEAVMAPGFIAGATELHDGRPALVIQPEELLKVRPGCHPNPAWRAATSPRLPGLETAWRDGNQARLLIFRCGSGLHAMPLGLLKEVIPVKHVTSLPILGDCWHGLFFFRGLCHGLLAANPEPGAAAGPVSHAAILEYPERCGVGVSEIVGYFDVPWGDLEITGDRDDKSTVTILGRFSWKGNQVGLVDIDGALRRSLVQESPVASPGRANAASLE